jgi:DDE domain
MLISMATCWTVGFRPRETCLRLRLSSDKPSHRRLYSRAHRHRQSNPSAIRSWAPDAKHTATGFYDRVILTNRCERNHGYVKSRLRPMRGLKSFDCAKRLFPTLEALQVIERGFVAVSCNAMPHAGGRSYVRARNVAAPIARLGQGVRNQPREQPKPSSPW